jgi:uncharacterized protein (TIGR02271 family)
MIDTNNIDALTGAKVVDRDDDKVGTVRQVYVDDASGRPLFVTVNTGLFGTKESFVPIENANFADGTLHVEYDKATIKDAPNVDDDGAIDDAEQSRIFEYYDRAGTGTAGTSGMGGTLGAADTVGGTAGAADTMGTTGGVGAGGVTGRAGTTGYDTSGPTTDDAMTRSEERLNVGTQRMEAGRARLRKHVVSEQQTVNVPTTHEEVRLEREPITEGNVGAAMDGPALSDEEHEVVLNEERPVVEKETVPVERVRLGKETVTEQQQVSENVRSEQIDYDGDGTTSR